MRQIPVFWLCCTDRVKVDVNDSGSIPLALLCKGRPRALAWALCLLLGLVSGIPIYGLSRDRTIRQYSHTAWTIQDGAPTQLSALAQTADGFLWIGSWNGLYRFDGVSFEHYKPPPGLTLPSPSIISLLSTPDGGLWISFTPFGVAFLKNGKLLLFDRPEDLPESHVYCFARDFDGRIWAGAQNGLLLFDGTRWRKVGSDWNFTNQRIWTMFVSRDGTLWVATDHTIIFLRRGSKAFQQTGLRVKGVPHIAQSKDGQLWMSEFSGTVRPIPYGSRRDSTAGPSIRVEGVKLLFDHDGSLWMAGEKFGAAHLRFPERLGNRTLRIGDPPLESFGIRDGLTQDSAAALLEDREGNIWYGSGKGLDRFSNSHFTPVRLPAGHRNLTLLPGNHGDLWVGSADRAPLLQIHGEEIVAKGPPLEIYSVCRDSQGVIWWGAHGGILKQDKEHFHFFSHPGEDANIWELVPDEQNGGLWVRLGDTGAFHFKDGEWTTPKQPVLPHLPLDASYSDSLKRAWLGYAENHILILKGTHTQSYSSAEGVDIGVPRVIREHGGTMWLGGDRGFAVLVRGRFSSIRTVDGERFGKVSGIIEAEDGALWLNESRAILRIPADDVRLVKDNPEHRVQFQAYDFRDGLPGAPQMSFRSSTSVQTTDGRLWFATDNGLAWINPAHVLTNSLAPPIHISSLDTNTKQYDPSFPVTLPRGTASLLIKYTAPSFILPERVRFRYKLEGADDAWRDAGNLRQAAYNNLSPGHYRFRVIACNSDGVWNQDGAALDFDIAPYWYQTRSFQILCVFLSVLLLWGLYRIRVLKIAQAMRSRFDERLAERTRIARELHDTFLQTVQASKLIADDALDNSANPDHMHRALKQLSSWLGEATKEGRAALNSLRSSTTEENDLAAAFRRATESCRIGDTLTASFAVDGLPRQMHPIVRDEIYRIGYEAIRNACAHSGGTQLAVNLRYDHDLLLRVRDNGIGIAPDIAAHGKDGHFGLKGMKERAHRIGGKLTIVSSAESGTEVTVIVPGEVVFRKAHSQPE